MFLHPLIYTELLFQFRWRPCFSKLAKAILYQLIQEVKVAAVFTGQDKAQLVITIIDPTHTRSPFGYLGSLNKLHRLSQQNIVFVGERIENNLIQKLVEDGSDLSSLRHTERNDILAVDCQVF